MEKLDIQLGTQNIGVLSIDNHRRALFEYAEDWLKNGFSISPFYLPLKAGVFRAKAEPFDGLFGVFADSLPDGWGNLLLDRFLLSQGIELSSLSFLERLSFVGKSGMGALSYIPDHSFKHQIKNYDLNHIASQVADILSEKSTIPTIKQLLEQTNSSGGARPKVLVQFKDESWMVKFPASNDDADIGEQEYFYSILAKKCGVEMPETQLFENKYFGTKLFDRKDNERFHIHSASGLLHASHRYPSLDYKQLALATQMLTKNENEVEKLVRLMVFNIVIANKDDHAKNFSFIFKDGKWNLSPAYDVLKSTGFGGEHATSVMGKGNPTINDIVALSKEINFSMKKTKQIVDEVVSICQKENASVF